MNIPNKVTLARIILTFFFVACLFTGALAAKVMALIIFALAALTDYADGWIAKKYGMTSDFGRIMDPVADKFLTLSAFVSFAIMGIVPGIFVAVIFVREILVTVFRLMALRSGKVMSAEAAGKHKTVSQVVSIVFILSFLVFREAGRAHIPFWSPALEFWFHELVVAMTLVAVGLTVISGILFFTDDPGRFTGTKPVDLSASAGSDEST